MPRELSHIRQVMKYYVDLLVNNGSRHLGILLAISLHYFDKAAEILLATKLVTVSYFIDFKFLLIRVLANFAGMY